MFVCVRPVSNTKCMDNRLVTQSSALPVIDVFCLPYVWVLASKPIVSCSSLYILVKLFFDHVCIICESAYKGEMEVNSGVRYNFTDSSTKLFLSTSIFASKFFPAYFYGNEVA